MQYDVILVSGEYWVDHPMSPVGVLKRVLEHNGFSVAIIEKPNWKNLDDFKKFGAPKLFFGVTAGTIDSMLCNYTPLKRKRAEDANHPYDSGMPDRAVTVYCNKLRECFKGVPLVIGGVEASMRRFAHYDYWENRVRKSLLVDTRADILVYGNGEWQIVEIAKRLATAQPISGVEGTCILAKEIPADMRFVELPSYDAVIADKKEFCKMQMGFSNERNLAQKQDTRYLLQYKMHAYTTAEIDAVFDLPFTKDIPAHYPEFKFLQFSIITHRGCFGNCSFCAIAMHQGNKILSRSEESILREIQRMTKHKDFTGVVEDLGGPSANMYGMDCRKCRLTNCMNCKITKHSHDRVIALMRKARAIPGVRKIYIHSGVRYDLAVESEEYIKELSEHHISGTLKIAPEHVSAPVLKLMNKYADHDVFLRFKKIFEKHNPKQGLKYYFMTAHPGSSMKEATELANAIKELRNTESVQIFTPTPMSDSTCMYYTGLDPKTLEPIYVPYTYHEKKEQKRILYGRKFEDADDAY